MGGPRRLIDLCARRSTSCNEMGPAGVALGAILSGLPDLRVFVMECAPPPDADPLARMFAPAVSLPAR